MIFTRYKGLGREFTEGKVYLASPEMDSGETISLDSLSVVSDSGLEVRINPEDDSFEYLDEVYAVVCRPIKGVDWEPGDVVIVNDATPESDGFLFRVGGEGLYRACHFITLDHTNVFPGLIIMDRSTGQWKKVMRVNERLGVMVGGCDNYRSPEEFRFAVSNDDILVEPIVRCVCADGQPTLTNGRIYHLLNTKFGTVVLRDDDGCEQEFMSDRFVMGE